MRKQADMRIIVSKEAADLLDTISSFTFQFSFTAFNK